LTDRLDRMGRKKVSRLSFALDLLPTEAYQQGWGLIGHATTRDKIILLIDQDGETIHEWNYIPSLAELFETCTKELNSGKLVSPKSRF